MLPNKRIIVGTILFIVLQLVTTSCGKEKKALPFYDTETSDESITESEDIGSVNDEYELMGGESDVSVPFIEKGSIKYVKVSINGQPFDMVFDTGCSGTLISVAEANYLYQNGCLSNEDILGTALSKIADGSIVENMVVNLKEVIIDNKIRFSNVNATVSANSGAPLLLGNEVLNRVPTYEIDNENKVIKFKL
nr:MAG TPA: gag-polyprotein putative aspartyl protease [Caudoviricetes sp.]